MASYEDQYELMKATYADYLVVLESEQKRSKTCGPHCDSLVLHFPGECEYCDLYPTLQIARLRLHINYTGKPRESWDRECPAEVLRSLERINRWPGNVPKGGSDA